MAVPFSRLVSEALDNYGSKQAFDNMARNNGVVAILGAKGQIEFEVGGQPDFRERTLYSYNTNIGYRAKNAPIPTTDDEGFTLISVPQKIVDGSLVFNQVELDQVRGNPAIAPGLIEDKIQQFNGTWVQMIANTFLQATPGSDDPYTLLPSATSGTVNGILMARTVAQQGAGGITTAGIDRSESVSIKGETYKWWANQYSNTSYDLSTTAGRAGLFRDVYAKCIRGSGKMFEPDFGLVAYTTMASLGAAADATRRGQYSSKEVLDLGFDNIMFYNAALIPDSSSRLIVSATVGKVCFLSSRGLKLKVLRGSGKVTQDMMSQNNGNKLKSLPIFWKNNGKEESDYNSLNWARLGYLVHCIIPKSLQDHGLADNCS